MKNSKMPQTLLAKSRLWIALGAVLIGFIACETVNRTVVVVPKTKGAEFMGSEDCMLCHDGLGRNFLTTGHARLVVNDESGFSGGCESCHGPGSLHSEEGGGAHLIHNPKRDSVACLQCHLDIQGQFALPNHHPVADGKVACIDCHDPHGNDEKELFAEGILEPESGSCASCHPAQAGPFVFEHEAMRDGCTACHDSHGSVNSKMLKIRNANLCLQCHFTEVLGNRLQIGGVDHAGYNFLQQGTCWTAGCHEAVHGSHVNGSLRF
ncbi:MAG: cytochrome c3 family protein [Puniceicoccaceae bacterium]